MERGDAAQVIERPLPPAPLVSVVVPALNEQMTVGEFVDWCWEGLDKAGVSGEVVIVDSSTDRTGEIARARGARVLSVPRRGLGRAYIDAIPDIRGTYVVMGDCDLTYDFRDLGRFVEKLEEGYEFVMGSRFTGYVEPGAMPALHRYMGTPVTTWILNRIYGTRYSDIHCGMRAMTLDALKRIGLESQGWEYASEMVLKAARLGLKTCEVPIRFYKDREGRVSHHRRAGFLSPWKAGWDNLRVMFLYAPDFFLSKPGWLAFVLGVALTLSLVGGPLQIAGVGLNLHWMLLGLTLATLGYGAVQLGVLARVYYSFDPSYAARIARIVTYNRGVASAVVLGLTGALLNGMLAALWLRSNLRLTEFSHPAILGLLLMIFAFQTFTYTLLLQMILRGRAKP